MTIDFSIRVETEDTFLGPMVLLVRRKVTYLPDGVKETLIREEPLEASLAVSEVIDPDNGEHWTSGHIEWGPVFDEWSY